MKTSSEKSSSTVLLAWHPNFRRADLLPDVKVVRTKFFINGLVIFITVSLAIFTVYREIEQRGLNAEIEGARKSIEKNKIASSQAVGLYKKFQEQQKTIQELKQFLSVSKLNLSELLLRLGSSLPASFTLTSVDFNAMVVTLKGGIRAGSAEGAGRASAYIDELKGDSYFQNRFESIVLANIIRDAGSGEIRFEVELRVKK